MEKITVKLTVARTGPTGGNPGQPVEVGLLEAARMMAGGQIVQPSAEDVARIKNAVAAAAAETVETAAKAAPGGETAAKAKPARKGKAEPEAKAEPDAKAETAAKAGA